MKLTISIVNWNTKEHLTDCLRSLLESDFKDFEIFVVDNNSSDGSCEAVRKLFPAVNLISNTDNLGFGKANNQAIKKANGEYILILNPDIIFYKDTLGQMISFMDKNPKTGVLGIKLLEKDGKESQKGYFRKMPSLTQVFLFYTLLENITLKNKFLRNKFWAQDDTGKITEISQIPGACLFSRKDLLQKIGGFDEDFKLFFEDVDLCYRIQKNGFKLIYNPEIKAVHIGAQSISKLPYDELAGRFYESMYLFFKKHHTLIGAKTAKIVILLNTFTKLMIFETLFTLSNYKREKRQKHIHTLWNLTKNIWKIE